MGQQGIQGGRKIAGNQRKWLLGWFLCNERGLEGGWPVVRELKVKTVTGEVLGRVANGS